MVCSAAQSQIRELLEGARVGGGGREPQLVQLPGVCIGEGLAQCPQHISGESGTKTQVCGF